MRINSETGTSFAPVDETLFQEMLNKGVTVLHDDIITDKTIVFNADNYEGSIDLAISVENNGWFNLKEGTYINSSLNKPTVMAGADAEVNVFGGVFKNKAYSSEPAEYKAILIDRQSQSKSLHVRGGTFYYQNPAVYVTEPGYVSEGVNGVYTVRQQ